MKRKAIFFQFFLFCVTLYCKGQDNVKFHGLDVIPFSTPNANKELLSIENELKEHVDATQLKRRDLSLDFFNEMNMIAEPSTISWYGFDYTKNSNPDYQKKPFVLNANIQIPISIGGKKWGLKTLQIIPQFKVRILQDDTKQNDSSLPVRTPSYMPGGFFYFSIPSMWKRDEKTRKLDGWFSGIHVFHHSDGQDQNEFNPNGTINVYNGNFSELLVTELLLGHVREYTSTWNLVNESGKRKNKSRTIQTRVEMPDRLFYWRLGFEWHEGKYITNQAFKKYNLYGRDRINFQAGLSLMPTYEDVILSRDKSVYYAVTPKQSKESWRFVFNASYIADFTYNSGDRNEQKKVGLFDLSKRLNISLTAYRRIPGAPYAAAFIEAGYYGSDSYNMYFQQSFMQIRGGLALAFFRYPKSGDFNKQ